LNNTGAKRISRKKPLPMPATWYRMPADWSEVEHGDAGDPPIAGGERYEGEPVPVPTRADDESFDTMTPERRELVALTEIVDHGRVTYRGGDIYAAEIIGVLIGFGYVVGKKKPRITKFGEKRLALLRDLAAAAVPVEDPAPETVLYRIDAALIEAVGKIGGHTVSMQTDPDGGGHLAKCPCGAEFRAPRAAIEGLNQIEHAIEAHWREVVADAALPLGDFPEIPVCLVRDPSQAAE
jgi:hypothetical protein